ncbi:MAG: methyltransferase [Plesiomonas sp.]|uniref:methyltransferase n=1 Tax=Plesiomonas sp. TaxID=2486279 RepID=UPI003F2F8C3B
MTVQTQFATLDALLSELTYYWQFYPFHSLEAYFQHTHPELDAALNRLSLHDIDRLDNDKHGLLAFLTPFIPHAPALFQAAQIPLIPRDERCILLPLFTTSSAISLRKQQQITDFIATMPHENQPILEWCAGKGHLGRALAKQRGLPVECLELQEALCLDGEKLAKTEGLSQVRFYIHDAFLPSALHFFHQQQHAIGLHACGALHMQLLRYGVQAKCHALTISPCCYHKIPTDIYQPMSETAKKSTLRLDKNDLRLSLQESVTGGERIKRLRHIEVSYRLGFDALQRQIRGEDTYLNVPNFPKALLTQDFVAFVHWAAKKKGLELPTEIDWVYWETVGQQRHLQVSRTELVRHLFRRPIEIWLALDRALYLQEQGYDVQLGEFCEHPITPRNIMIHGKRKQRD